MGFYMGGNEAILEPAEVVTAQDFEWTKCH